MHRSVDIKKLAIASQSDPTTYLYAARALRDFGDGFVAVLLPVYLTALGLGALEVGVVATLALFGSALMTLGIGRLGARTDQRRLLIGASGLMIATGLAFAASSSYAASWWSPSWAPSIPRRAASASSSRWNTRSSPARWGTADRTRMFARYSLIGALAAAAGALAAGSPDLLAAMGVSHVTALKGMFVVYAVLGLAGGFMYAHVPADRTPAEEKPAAALGPSRGIVYKMAALFSVDAFAGGFAVQSLVALWLFNKFGMSLSAAGVFFFWSGVLRGVLVSGCRLAVAADRAREHNGLHAYPFEPVPDPCGRGAEPRSGARSAPATRRPLADGCTDALFLRYGRCYTGRAASRCERHLGSAQSRGCRQPRDGRGAICRRVRSMAARDLRGSQDSL